VSAYPIEVYWSDEDGAWIAVAPDLLHCAAHGPTPHEAVAEVEDAIAACIEVAESTGREIPRLHSELLEHRSSRSQSVIGLTRPGSSPRSSASARADEHRELADPFAPDRTNWLLAR
jgi:predicted RNase H-like HicB family nuclease